MANDLKKKINALLESTLKDNLNKKNSVVIGTVNSKEAHIFKKLFDIDIKGYKHTIDSFSIRHILKEHGDVRKEKLRGQVEVTQSDFIKSPQIIKSQNALSISKNKQGRVTIIYSFESIENIFYIEELRTRKKELALNTMYKRKPPRKT